MQRFTHGLPQEMLEDAQGEFLSAYSVDPFGSLLLLPTPAMVRQTRKRMMDSGLGVASSSVVTLEGLALQILEDQGAGLTFLDEMESTVLLRQVLMRGVQGPAPALPRRADKGGFPP